MTRIRWITGLILLLALSGALLAVVPPLTAWRATLIITISHILLSVILLILTGPILYHHVRRSGRWRAGSLSSWCSLALLGLIILTGGLLLTQGQRGRLGFVHSITGLILFAFILAHSGFAHVKHLLMKSLRLVVTATFISLIAGAVVSSRSSSVNVSTDSRQFPPASFRILGELPDYDEKVMGAKRCAECHKEIAEQWRESMHAMADTELFYARVVGEFRKEYGFEASNWCAGCHSPLRLGRGELNEKVASVAQPNVDCVICHSIRSVHEPLGNNNYDLLIARPSGYEFARSKRLSDQLLLIQPDAHRSMWNGSLMRSPEFCGACHRQVLPDFLSNGQSGLVLQDTYTEWAQSKYNSNDATVRRTCQDCHMPTEPGFAKDLGKKRPSHLFLGVSIDIARISGSHNSYAEGKRFLQKVATIEVIPSVRGKEIVELLVKVTNSGAGHNLPTGVADLRQVWLAVTVTNEAGEVVFESGKIDEHGFLDPSVVTFGTKLGDGKGNPVLFHHIARAREILSDTSIPAGETREVKYVVPVLDSKRLQADVKLLYRAVPQSFINHYMTPDLRSEVVVMSKASTDINLSK